MVYMFGTLFHLTKFVRLSTRKDRESVRIEKKHTFPQTPVRHRKPESRTRVTATASAKSMSVPARLKLAAGCRGTCAQQLPCALYLPALYILRMYMYCRKVYESSVRSVRVYRLSIWCQKVS